MNEDWKGARGPSGAATLIITFILTNTVEY